MDYDNKLIAAKLKRWETYINKYHLPEWDEIPDLGLYMEQVLVFLQDCLDYLPPELKEEQYVTPSTINNYVRKNVMPEPVKKRYYRIHIAYLIIILTLKRSLTISLISKILPNGLSEEEVEEIYTNYVKRHKETEKYFIEMTKTLAAPILGTPDESGFGVDNASDLILDNAIIGYYTRFIAVKLLLLDQPENQADIGAYEKPVKADVEERPRRRRRKK